MSQQIQQIQQILDDFTRYLESNRKVVIRRFSLYNATIKKEKKEIEEMLIKWSEPSYACINRGYCKWGDLIVGHFFISFQLYWSYKDTWAKHIANNVIQEYQLKYQLNSPEEAYNYIKNSKNNLDYSQDVRLMYV